jgi:3-oxoacyl-[acyl-carrier protein] reductase
VAIVVGASRGVGHATVLRLAAQGYAVVVCYAHDQGAADSTVDAILAANGAAVAVRADAADELDVERLFAETNDVFGGVDVVVLAVIGDISRGPVSNLELADFDALWRTNGRATFIVNREAARHLRDGGSIVNLTSSIVGRPLPGYGGYTATKVAADVLTRVLALDLNSRGITVNAVTLDVEGECEPDRFADIVAHLLSDEGRSVTGRVIRVDPSG